MVQCVMILEEGQGKRITALGHVQGFIKTIAAQLPASNVLDIAQTAIALACCRFTDLLDLINPISQRVLDLDLLK